MRKKILILIFTVILSCIPSFAVTIPNASVSLFSPEQRSDKTESVWLRPYVSFETVELENGKTVHNNGFGTYLGYDGKIITLNNDWDLLLTYYTGYSGARQSYASRKLFQTGGLAGVSGMFFRNDIYAGFAFSTGASNVSLESVTGEESFSMMSAVAALKTGYNADLLNEKIIIQPSFLCAYIFVNTFDYENSEQKVIKSEPVHSLQFMPGFKVTANLKNGLQPYFGVQYVWNIINDSNFTANDASVGEISVKPFIRYGLGVQKSFTDDFSGYFQTTVSNGGRSGVILSLGVRKLF